MPKAKLFMNGGSQAVRLPAEFRFEGDEVDIRKNPKTGDVILSPRKKFDVEEFVAFIETLSIPEDFMQSREQEVDDFESPFDRVRKDD